MSGRATLSARNTGFGAAADDYLEATDGTERRLSQRDLQASGDVAQHGICAPIIPVAMRQGAAHNDAPGGLVAEYITGREC
jgi:hypothetical protein